MKVGELKALMEVMRQHGREMEQMRQKNSELQESARRLAATENHRYNELYQAVNVYCEEKGVKVYLERVDGALTLKEQLPSEEEGEQWPEF